MKVNNSKGQLTYQIDIDKQQSNGFPISCDFMTTGKLGCLYPTQALRVQYGDKINNLSSVALQFNPLAVPMLANMFVKQEHYYTPYNCVWDNFDNFISGGEDLDYTTPPPTSSMFSIMQYIQQSWLTIFRDMPICWVRAKSAGQSSKMFWILGVKVRGESTIFERIGACRSRIISYGETLGVRDIVETYFVKVLDELEKVLRDYLDNNRKYWAYTFVPLMNTYYPSGDYTAPEDPDDVFNDLGFASQSAELPEDWKSMMSQVNRYANSTLAGTAELYSDIDKLRLTDVGYNFFSLLYKLIRPLVGVGSYLDLLNIGKYLPSDFYYLMMSSLLNTFGQVNSVEFPADTFMLRTDYTFGYDYLRYISGLKFDVLNLRVQYLIWYNNYRDQLLEIKAPKPEKGNTPTENELFTLLVPRHRCWEKDSYTTALDNPATADAVVPTGNQRTHETLTMKSFSVDGAGADEIYRNDGTVYNIKFADGENVKIPTGFISGLASRGSDSNTTTSYFSLHMLDAVKRAQKFMRKALYYGNRIQDFINVNFGVAYLDARLRLPEILSSSTDMVQLTTLVNNTTTEVSDAGDRAGYANAYDKGNGFSRYCEEAGVIMSFLTVMPQPTYGYGSDRQYFKLDRFDYPFPDFATLGMDAVFDNELAACPNKILHTKNDALSLIDNPLVFGYQGRYYDSKYRQSTEHGELLTTQDMYTFGRKWNLYEENGRPLLNYEFVHCFPRLDMFVMKDNTEDIFRADVHHDTMAELKLPYHSIYL